MFGTRCAAARYFRGKFRLRELEAVKLQQIGEQLLHCYMNSWLQRAALQSLMILRAVSKLGRLVRSTLLQG